MRTRYRDLPGLRQAYAAKEDAIRSRLRDFEEVGRRPDALLFEELCYCLLVTQSKARVCDAAVRSLVREGLLWTGDVRALARHLRHRVRFHNHKARYIVAAREHFFPGGEPQLRRVLDRMPSPREARAWFVAEVDGLGLKEASHFLRNTGRGQGLAILDRHILRNLVRHGVIDRIPPTLTRPQYLRIEGEMTRFAETVGVPLEALDLLLWSRETGEIFK